MLQQDLSYQGTKTQLYIRSGVLFFAISALTLLISPMMLIATLLSSKICYSLAKLWVKFSLWLVEHICGLKYEVYGLEHLHSANQAIILSKHQSAWETIAFIHIFPPLSYVLKRSLLWLPFWGWAMATLKPIAINRGNQRTALRELLTQGRARLKEGLWVVIFPEGTRTAPGEKKKFNAGGSLLAQQSGFPVIPVAHNAGQFWPRYSFLKYPGIIKVKIGPLIESKGKKASQLNAEVEHWISQAMEEINVPKVV